MRKRTRGSHKGDERKSGAIRMMPFARSSSLNLSPYFHPLRRYTVFLLSTPSTKIIERSSSVHETKKRLFDEKRVIKTVLHSIKYNIVSSMCC